MTGAGFGPEYLELMIIDIEIDPTTDTVLYLDVGDDGIWKGQSFGRSGQGVRRDTTAQSFLELQISPLLQFGSRHCLRSNDGHISGHVE
jgi:hypothetical protein